MENKPSFLKNHADAIAVVGVNIAIGAILVSMWLSNCSNINAVNARMDAFNARMDAMSVRMDTVQMMIYDMLRDAKK